MERRRAADGDDLTAERADRRWSRSTTTSSTTSTAEGPLPIATPVFDGATQVDVDEALMGWVLAHPETAPPTR